MIYEVEMVGQARELYLVSAESKDDAREQVERGDVEPFLTEVEGAEITTIERRRP